MNRVARATLADLGRSRNYSEHLYALQRQAVPASAIAGMPPAIATTQVPLPFDPKATIDWTPVWSMSREEMRAYLPIGVLLVQLSAAP